MVEEDWQPLRDLGFDDQACLEAAHIVDELKSSEDHMSFWPYMLSKSVINLPRVPVTPHPQ